MHCVADSDGAAFHPDLAVAIDEVFLKGRHTASYTGFDGGAAADESVPLGDWLRLRRHARRRGRAGDRPLREGHRPRRAGRGFATAVLLDHCAGVAPETTEAGLDELRTAGVALR
ncbi:MAG: hypothetical protein R2695_05985 [Acidimicrobiales bacterium]